MLVQVWPEAWQSGVLAHSSTHTPSWQAPRLQSPSALHGEPGPAVPRRGVHAGWMRDVGVGAGVADHVERAGLSVGHAASRPHESAQAPSRQ